MSFCGLNLNVFNLFSKGAKAAEKVTAVDKKGVTVGAEESGFVDEMTISLCNGAIGEGKKSDPFPDCSDW